MLHTKTLTAELQKAPLCTIPLAPGSALFADPGFLANGPAAPQIVGCEGLLFLVKSSHDEKPRSRWSPDEVGIARVIPDEVLVEHSVVLGDL